MMKQRGWDVEVYVEDLRRIVHNPVLPMENDLAGSLIRTSRPKTASGSMTGPSMTPIMSSFSRPGVTNFISFFIIP